jgi:ABC-2 type transport system permease protein
MVTEKKQPGSKRKRRDLAKLLVLIVAIALINFVASWFFRRFDLTSEKRYTLSESTRGLLKTLNDDVLVKVYLNADFNPGFARLKNEAREMLDEFRAYSGRKVHYEFIALGEGLTKDETAGIERQLFSKGLLPEELTVRGREKTTQALIWPGAVVSYKGREAVWQIYTRQSPGIDFDESLNNSVEELEYSLTNTIRKLQRDKKAEVTFLEGHDELDTLSAYHFMKSLSEYYKVNRTALKKGFELSALKGTDALIIAQPDSAFSDKEAYVIDQFIMNGGKVLWLIDPVETNLDSLRRNGFTIALNRPLNIEEMLFKYGVRLNPVLVQDMQCGYLNLNTGFEKGQPRFKLFPWLYFPLVMGDNSHPIVKNLDLIKFDYLSTLDTIASAHDIRKTILLKTSRYTRTQPAPARIYLSMAQRRPKETQFRDSYQNVACLLEGSFTSFVENRLPSVFRNDSAFRHLDKGKPTRMIVVADGDVARNDFQRSTGQVFPLGFDRNTQQTFANRTFLLNCVNYLLDDEGLLQLRAREVKLRLLDKKKIASGRGKWQMINVALPLLLLVGFATAQFYTRRRKYARGV